ncbi:MAG: DUF1028 domain-containing protein [Steroidobacteraceae bacterium]
MTFSIAARSADGGMFGVAIASSSPAVAARCAHARAGIGAAASQNITDPRLGTALLEALARGLDAGAALAEVLRGTPFGAYRQLLVVGHTGPPAVYSGAHALGIVGSAVGVDCAAAGNLLARADIPTLMIAAFEACGGHFGACLLEALRAGAEGGGEAGPVHSAGLLVVRDVAWPIVDLRVDWTEEDPVAALAVLWRIFAPQIDDYVARATNPAHAPSFGVAGDR